MRGLAAEDTKVLKKSRTFIACVIFFGTSTGRKKLKLEFGEVIQDTFLLVHTV